MRVLSVLSGANEIKEEVFCRCFLSQYVAGCLHTCKYVISTHKHANMCEPPTPQDHSNPHDLKPCSPHINEAAPIFHHGRCVAVATWPFHLRIPHWVCIFRLAPSSPLCPSQPPLPPPIQSITCLSHPSPLIGLFFSCPPFKVSTFIHG